LLNDLIARISVSPDVMVGKPCIRGTRITVEHILRELAAGVSPDDLLREHPRLTAQDIRAAQLYAADHLAGDDERYG